MRSGRFIAVALATVLALVLAGSASAAPAVEQYNTKLPNATGPKTLGPTTPQSNPSELNASTRSKLGESSDGETLEAIATADELGAPPPAAGDLDVDDRGLLAALLSALLDPLGLAVILGLAGITTAVVLQRSRGGIGGPPA